MTEALGSTDRTSTRTASRLTPGTPCWMSLMAHDLTAARKFYATLFGWTFRPGPHQLGPYVGALLGDRDVAGIGQLPPNRHLTVRWTPFFATDDVNATADLVRLCGGTVGVGPLDAGDAGRLAVAVDPCGAVFGLWQATGLPGLSLSGAPGSLAWNELLTYDSADAGFYEAVFGYNRGLPRPTADAARTLHVDGRAVASAQGMGRDLPGNRGAHWMTYFETGDVDRSARRVVELGGRLVEAARDTRFGRTAVVADPQGGVFRLLTTDRQQT
ncbi:VOC family protein [Streptomyces sp. NPDC050560]|uniref:VOC family protein n=1 Tax=Streptomyces sp. NPDC050560 TaxID=3365630 RepID=UPI0037B048D0